MLEKFKLDSDLAKFNEHVLDTESAPFEQSAGGFPADSQA